MVFIGFFYVFFWFIIGFQCVWGCFCLRVKCFWTFLLVANRALLDMIWRCLALSNALGNGVLQQAVSGVETVACAHSLWFL